MSGPAPDRASLERLYRAEYPRTVHLARLLTGDHHRAEELAQEAFVRVAGRVDDLENPAGYLHTTLVNLCRDHGRRAATVRRTPLDPPLASPEPPLPRDVDEIWQAVQGLSERRREAVVLRYWADLPLNEVARLLGVRPGTARSLVHRGLADLKEVLTDER